MSQSTITAQRIPERRQGVTLNGKETELVNMAVAVYVGQVRNMLPVNNRAWSVIATVTRKLENRKMYHSAYDNDFTLELELLEALQRDQERKETAQRVKDTIQWEKDFLQIPTYQGENKYI